MRRRTSDRGEWKRRLLRATYALTALFLAVDFATQIGLRIAMVSIGYGPMSPALMLQPFVDYLPWMFSLTLVAYVVKMWAPFVFEGIVEALDE